MPQAIPEGQSGIIPHLVCSPCAEALEFYREAFGAEELCRMPAPDGQRLMHAAMTLDGATFFLADEFPEYCDGESKSAKSLGGTPITLHRYVKDCDAAIAQAERAGATVKMPAADMFWGDRYGVVEDPYGLQWAIATHVKDMTPEEMDAGMQEAFQQQA